MQAVPLRRVDVAMLFFNGSLLIFKPTSERAVVNRLSKLTQNTVSMWYCSMHKGVSTVPAARLTILTFLEYSFIISTRSFSDSLWRASSSFESKTQCKTLLIHIPPVVMNKIDLKISALCVKGGVTCNDTVERFSCLWSTC